MSRLSIAASIIQEEGEKEMSALESVLPPSDAIPRPRFCSPYTTDLTFFSEKSWLDGGVPLVTDANGDLVFKIESRSTCKSFRIKQLITDRTGKPVISLRQKMCSLHDRWHIFFGDSFDAKDLWFTVKRRALFQFKSVLDVFLAANTKQEVSDFEVRGSFPKKSCVVHKGDSSCVIAQMSQEHKSVSGSVLSPNAFGVSVSPNVDYSFITALVIVLIELERAEQIAAIAGASAGASAAVVSAVV